MVKIIKFIKQLRERLNKENLLYGKLWITERCYLSCGYCSSVDNSSTDPSFNELKDRIDKLAPLVGLIDFYGGEPLLREDLPELIRHAKERGAYSYVATSARHLDENYLRRLGEAGIAFIHYAVDFSHPVEGKKYLDDKRLDMLLKGRERYHYGLLLNHCIFSGNKGELDKILENVGDRKIVTTVHLAMKQSSNVDDSVFLSQGEISEVVRHIVSLQKQGFPVLPLERDLREWEKYTREAAEWECGAGKDFITVDLNGNIIPCAFLRKPLGHKVEDLNSEIIRKTRAEIENDYLPFCNPKCVVLTPLCASSLSEKLPYLAEIFGGRLTPS